MLQFATHCGEVFAIKKIARGRRRDHGRLRRLTWSPAPAPPQGAPRVPNAGAHSPRQGAGQLRSANNLLLNWDLRQGRELLKFSALQDGEGRSSRRFQTRSNQTDARAIRHCGRIAVKRASAIEKNSSPDKQIASGRCGGAGRNRTDA